MAKSGFWLKGAKGKFAGSVLQNSTVGTIMRENVRPRNPKSEGQIWQRAIMSTVMKAYSKGKAIFDHSFEGQVVGYGNQRRFMSLNAQRLRSLAAQDLEGGYSQVHFSVPKLGWPVPNQYQISEGSLVQTLFQDGKMTAPETDETFAQYFSRLGIVSDDIFTLVVFATAPTADPYFVVSGYEDIPGAKLFGTHFAFARMCINPSILTSTTVIDPTAATLGQIFNFIDVYNIELSSIQNLALEETLYSIFTADEYEGSYAIIRSRRNKDLRSTEYMTYFTAPGNYGITAEYVIQAWQQGSQTIGNSPLILEGGNQGV